MSVPLRGHHAGMSRRRVAMIATVLIFVGVYLAFTKDIPFTHDLRLHAMVESSAGVKPNSPVRIAGVTVGKVLAVERKAGAEMVDVVFEVKRRGLPIHRDATVKIRSRIFLEGNFFLDVKPGSPSAPSLEDGDVIPATQTDGPAQIDQLLGVLNADARGDLQTLVQEYGVALNSPPTAAEDADQERFSRGETAAQSLNDALRYFPAGVRDTAYVGDAFLGSEPHDLSRLIRGLRGFTAGFGRHEQQLGDMVTNFNLTLAAFSANASAFSEMWKQIAATILNAEPALIRAQAGLPHVRRFARGWTGGIGELPKTIDAAEPWVRETYAMLSPDEVQGLLADIRPSFARLATMSGRAPALFDQLYLASRCFDDVVIPTMSKPVDDPPHSTGVATYKEFWYAIVGAAGESQNFDGNGRYVRLAPGTGDNLVTAGPGKAIPETYRARTNRPVQGARPALPGKRPPFSDKRDCYRNPLPDLTARTVSGSSSGPGATVSGGSGAKP